MPLTFVTLLLPDGSLIYVNPERIHGFGTEGDKVAVYFNPGFASQTDMTLGEFLAELANPRTASQLLSAAV